MQTTNEFCARPMLRQMTYRHIEREGEDYPSEEAVLSEHSIRISVNGSKVFRQICLPQHLKELTLGHLMTEGWIAAASDVSSLAISENGEEIFVWSKSLSEKAPLSAVVPAAWRAEWVFALADRFSLGMPFHGQTFATHSCFLARGEELLFECEDIGRHNALDKAVGYALCNGIDLKDCFLYSSGRIPLDMVKKAIRAGVPLLAGKGSPTAEAVELARRHGLTLICAARRDRMKQFSGYTPQGQEGEF